MQPTYLPRHIDSVLESWQLEAHPKPLILRGARQTGKSSSVRALGAKFPLFLELNLERRADLALVRACRSPEELLAALRVRHDLHELPKPTLLFLDELQESPEAISWLRFFREEHPDVRVIGAGSLLEVRLAERGFSFPVGRVTFRALHPFSFFEFARAVGAGVLVDTLSADWRALPPVHHEQAMELLRQYLAVGGMPEAVSRWVETQDPLTVRQVHADLLQAFAEDIQKYRLRDTAYVEAAFEALPHHYGQRFHYTDFAPGYRTEPMKRALDRLESAMIVTRVWPTSSLALPLERRPRSAPKLLPLDIGLALHGMGVRFGDPSSPPVEQLLDGRAAEICVGQQLLSEQEGPREPLHFWVRETARANAELDYLLATRGRCVPVEVKAGPSGRLRSLHQFLRRAGADTAFRLHGGLPSDEQHEVEVDGQRLRYRLLTLPLYLAERLPSIAAEIG